MHSALYYLAIAFLITHELDAVTHSEWRLLFLLRDLEETKAAQAFVILHVPLVFAVLWFSQHAIPRVRDRTQYGVALFLVVHALIHFSLSGKPEYDFDGILSRSLILSSAVCGALFLVGRWRTLALETSD